MLDSYIYRSENWFNESCWTKFKRSFYAQYFSLPRYLNILEIIKLKWTNLDGIVAVYFPVFAPFLNTAHGDVDSDARAVPPVNVSSSKRLRMRHTLTS
jgi:hypothetical protein